MSDPFLLTWRHFEADIIRCAVRWYRRDALSDRDVEALMHDRGMVVDHTTVFRWVQRDTPELDQRCRPHLRFTNDSDRVDETYIRHKKQWHYLDGVVDSQGQTVDFLLRTSRDAEAAERLFRKLFTTRHTASPRGITVDQNAAYPRRLVKIFELAFPQKVTPLPSPALRLVFRSTLTHTQRHHGRQSLRGEAMDWKHLLAYITGTVERELLLRNEYLVTENRILRNQINGRVRLSDGERKTLADPQANPVASKQVW